MSGFLADGRADLTGYRLGQFIVDRLVGRDRAGAPRWELQCTRCRTYQILGHTKLARLLEGKHSQNHLQCTNAVCRASQPQPESLGDFLRRERKQAEQAAQAEAERQKAAELEAAKERAKEQRLDQLKADYREFWLHHIKLRDFPEAEIPPLKRWLELSGGDRQKILESIRKNPNKWWKF